MWFILFLVLPVLVIGFDQLVFLYKSWYQLLAADHAASTGISVTGFLKAIFPSVTINNLYVLLTGLILLLLPLIRIKQYKFFIFRIFFLSSIIIWSVIFNHKAESPTFIIAMTGVGIWFFSQERKTENIVLLLFALVLTSLSSTDLVPGSIRDHYIAPFCLKVLPCIIVWLKISAEMILNRPSHNEDLDLN
jgi:hypothetical protein